MNNLQEFITENDLEAKILTFDKPTRTVEESQKMLKCRKDDIVKSLVTVTDKNLYYIVLIQGNRRLKTQKLKKLLITKDAHLAAPNDVKKVTTYDVGNVPPISTDLPVVIDERILLKKRIYAGGGEKNKTLSISVKELIDITHPLVADISKSS